MSKDYRLYFDDVRQSIAKIRRYTAGLDFDRFTASELVVDAVVRNLMVIGEAVKRIPREKLASRPDMPWKEIAGMRDVVIHAYDNVDLPTVWNVIQLELAALDECIEQWLNEADAAASE